MSDPMPSRDPMPASQVPRWCEQHNRAECVKQRSKGRGQCHGIVLAGYHTCYHHAGKTKDVVRAQVQIAEITAWSAEQGEPGISPDTAVMRLLHMSWRRIHIYAQALQEQAQGVDNSILIAGLIGYTYTANARTGDRVETGEAIRGLARLEAEERDRCVRYAKAAHDMGIADREMKLAEDQAAVIVGVLFAARDRFGWSPESVAWVAEQLAKESDK